MTLFTMMIVWAGWGTLAWCGWCWWRWARGRGRWCLLWTRWAFTLGHYCKKLTPPFIPLISYVSDCKVSQELKEMKETVTSVQASLITSVSLIQGRYHYLLSRLSRLQSQYWHLITLPTSSKTLIKIKMKDKSFVYSLTSILLAHNFQTLESLR